MSVFVVRRTFLELVTDDPAAGSVRRSRTLSDTGFSLPEHPVKVDEKDDLSDSSTQAPADNSDSDTESCRAERVLCWADEDDADDKTTLMFRNLPNEYSRDAFTGLLDAEGFAGRYDFVYVPIDFKSANGFGYAFVNMTSHRAACQFMRHFTGFSGWQFESSKVAEVTWSSPSQGYDAHVERYRNSPVMHEAVPDEFKPAMFAGGKRVAFPAPTKFIKMPRMRVNQK
jgi:hypothetical protein